MAESLHGIVASFNGNATLSAGRVVALGATPNQVGYHVTQTSQILGVSIDDNKQAGSAIAIQLNGIARVVCNASVTAGELVGPVTDSAGKIGEVNDALTTTAALLKVLGIALEAGSTDSVIRVAIQIENRLQLG